MDQKILLLEVVFMIWSIPTKNHLFKINNEAQGLGAKTVSRLRTKALERLSCRILSVNKTY